MAIPLMNEDVEIIQKLNDLPNQEDGLSAEQMKEKFDAASVLIKAYLNGTLVPAVQQLQKALNYGDIIGLDDTLSAAGQAADAAAVGTALAGKLPWGENIVVNSSTGTGSAWDLLRAAFLAMPSGTVMYCRVSNAVPYAGDNLPAGGLVAEIAKTGSSGDHPYGYVRLVSYQEDALGMPTEITRRYMGEEGWKPAVNRSEAILAKINAAMGVAE